MDAARILMRDGWTQGTYGDADGVCVDTAITQACTDSGVTHWPEAFRAKAVLSDWLKAQGYGACWIAWNDKPEHTAEDILLGLKRAASESA